MQQKASIFRCGIVYTSSQQLAARACIERVQKLCAACTLCGGAAHFAMESTV